MLGGKDAGFHCREVFIYACKGDHGYLGKKGTNNPEERARISGRGKGKYDGEHGLKRKGKGSFE